VVCFATAALAGAASLYAGHASSLPLKVAAKVALPGPTNRFDYMSLDPESRRLYIAHMNAGELLFFDVRRRRVVRTIPAPGVHGVIVVPSLHRVYASATDDRRLLTIDAQSGKILARAPAGEYPDGVAYAPAARRVFVSDESGRVLAVFSAGGHRVGTVDLDGEAGNVQYDSGTGRILVDVQSRDEVAVVDPRTNRMIRRVELPGCDHDHGLLIDASRRLAFVACDGNAKLLTLDLRRMKVTATDDVGDDPDVLAFDRSLRRLYVAAESGEVAVFGERGRRLAKLGQDHLASDAHTVAVDPRTHLVYFPLEDGSHGHPELLIMAPS
jgi:DNA-binding beta-propeller fold protein YncE